MRGTIGAGIRAALGLFFLGLPLVQLAWTRAPAPPSTPEEPMFVVTSPFVRATRRGPVDQALREAAAYEAQAKQMVDDLAQAPVAWEAATEDRGAAVRQRLAYDYGGHLRAARRAARRAASLAQTPAEACRAAQLLAHLECLAGHHHAELRQSRRLVTLAPRDPASWRSLQHARRCSGVKSEARRRPKREGPTPRGAGPFSWRATDPSPAPGVASPALGACPLKRRGETSVCGGRSATGKPPFPFREGAGG